LLKNNPLRVEFNEGNSILVLKKHDDHLNILSVAKPSIKYASKNILAMQTFLAIIWEIRSIKKKREYKIQKHRIYKTLRQTSNISEK
jgi:hypothetical protein